METKRILTIVEIVAVAVLIVVGFYGWRYWQKRQAQEPLPTYLSEEATKALEAAQNPVKNLAETNPFKNEETNPLLNKYKNPFE